MVLSDRTIKEEIKAGHIIIEPFNEADIQPASIDLHLDDKFRVFRNIHQPFIDVKLPQDDLTEMVTINHNDPLILHPREFVLGSTKEKLTLPDDIVARVEGKSSLGRLGLLIHSTAGYVDPGWSGHLTLELSNVSNLPITLYYGMPIGQISFLRLSTPAEKPYNTKGLGSKYQGQREPTASRYFMHFRGDKP